MAATGELVELLAKALRRARMGANDRGVMGRLRGAGETFVDEPSPGFARTDIYPERLNDVSSSNPVRRDPSWARENDHLRANWNLTPEAQENFASQSPLERARFFSEHGAPEELTPYELATLRSHDPKEVARMMWGVDDPVARMALIGAGIGGGGLSLREVLRDRNQWSA